MRKALSFQGAPEGFPLSLGRDFALTPGSDTPRGINEPATRQALRAVFDGPLPASLVTVSYDSLTLASCNGQQAGSRPPCIH